MAQYYAKIENGIVTGIHVVADALVETEGERAGSELLASLHGGEYVRFSKTGEFRFNRAIRGSLYDSGADAFYSSAPFESWTLDSDFKWQPPTPKPEGDFTWNEDTQTWEAVDV